MFVPLQLVLQQKLLLPWFLLPPRKVLPLLRENRSMRILAMPEKRDEVTAEVLACLLKPSYSVLGSNKRPKEELIVIKFREFLQCVESKWAHAFFTSQMPFVCVYVQRARDKLF